MKQLKIKEYPELFASLREWGYNPFFSNGHLEIERSNCCFEPLIEDSDFCSKCKEHCEGIKDEK